MKSLASSLLAVIAVTISIYVPANDLITRSAVTAVAPTIAGGWRAPLDSMPAVETGFKANNCGKPGYGSYIPGKYHLGNDFPRPAGTAVKAIGAGTVVTYANFGAGWANALFVRHKAGNGTQFVALYGHVNSSLRAGATVSSGQTIATLANISGPHLHLGLRPNAGTLPSGGWGMQPCANWPGTNGFTDPLPWLKAHPAAKAASNPAMSGTYRGSRLTEGQWLGRGQYLMSPNGMAVLELSKSGVLAVYGPHKKKLWGFPDKVVSFGVRGGKIVANLEKGKRWSKSAGVASINMQDDGNLVARNSKGKALWSTGTGGQPAYRYFGSDRLLPGQKLTNDRYIRSGNGKFFVLMKRGGTFAAYGPNYHIFWEVKASASHPLAYAVLQGDGRFVDYTSGGDPIWVAGPGIVRVVVQNDGNWVFYGANNRVIWASGPHKA